MRLHLGRAAAICWALCASVARAGEPAAPQIMVFAAASLSESVQQLATAFQQQTGVRVRASFASSAALARQIDAGASADVFISADAAWMDELDAHQRLSPGSRRNLVANELVLIAPAGSQLRLQLGPHAPLAAALHGGRLALADPDSVPAGRYARAALMAFGLWSELEAHLVRAEDVRVALAWVARGEAPLGVVYATDARVEPRVTVLDRFPASSHPPIVYPVALLAAAPPAAARFVAFLESPAGRAVFAKAGFTTP
jgi:molybdate transport system substrate-binding protein